MTPDSPEFECKCCGQCCHRDPYYAVSLLDIRNISMGLGMAPEAFFDEYCDVVMTPGGFRYSVILAPDGCPFLKGTICGIHIVKPIGCWVFPESSLLPVTLLKQSVTAIKDCGIMELPDDYRALKADYMLMAARDVHFEETRDHWKKHGSFDKASWEDSADRLAKKLQDAADLQKRAEAIRMDAERLMESAKRSG
jgi:uncharacterized protein